VLMQKVSKEVLARIQKRKHIFPKVTAPASFDVKSASLKDLLYVFVEKEKNLFTQLGHELQSKISSGKSLFEVWMGEESDLIQQSARAFGERIALERFIKLTEEESTSELKEVLANICQLFALRCMEEDLGYFLTSKLLSLDDGKKVPQKIRELCRVLSPHALPLTPVSRPRPSLPIFSSNAAF